MEPERKIEKLLRAYAKKRRADAGDLFTLHPATRQMLHSAAARPSAEPPEADSVSLWQLFRQRWAFLAGFALLIFFVATMFLPPLSRAKMKSQQALAMSHLKQIGEAVQLAADENNDRLPATLDTLTNEMVISEKTLTDPESKRRFIYAGGGEKLDELQSNAVLAYSPEDKNGRAVLLADGSVRCVNRAEFRALTNQSRPQTVLALNASAAAAKALPAEAPVPAAAPTASPPRFAGTLESVAAAQKPVLAERPMAPADTVVFAGGAVTDAAKSSLATKDGIAAQHSRSINGATTAGVFQFGLGNSQRFVQTAKPVAKTARVLSSFELQQNGNALAVVDSDGSIYHGSLQPEAETPTGTVEAGRLEISRGTAANVANQTAQNYFFRVAGENRTLKQNIVFTGNLIAMTNAPANTAQTTGGQSQSAVVSSPAAPAQQLFSNSRIAGTVVIGDTNRIHITAWPVTP